MSKRLVLLYAAALCLLLNFLIPPFQNPDEPQHFGAVLIYALGSSRGPEIEERVIEQMDRFDWWRMAGMGRPAELPRRFADIPFLHFAGSELMASQLVLYHAAAGSLLRLVPSEDVLTLYYVCRLFSAVLFCGSLLLLAAAFSQVARGIGQTAGLGFFFILFLPQFSVLSLSVNPESLAIFWGALFFYALAARMSGRAGRLTLAVLPVAALGGFLTDRTGFFLVPLALILPFFFLKRGQPARSLTLIGGSLLVTLVAASWAAWLLPVQVYSGLSAVREYFLRGLPQAVRLAAPPDFAARYFLRLLDSFWLKFGWMAFPAPGFFYYVWRTAALLSFLGILVLAGRRLLGFHQAGLPEKPGPARTGRLVGVCAAAVGLQLAALWVTSLPTQSFAQGRYLFPVIFPLALLFVLGLESLGDIFGRLTGRVFVAAFLIFEVIFFVLAVWSQIAPVFHLTVRAPHPGI